MSKVELICGRSRAGKTTYSKKYEKVIHLDLFGLPPKNYDEVIKEVSMSVGDVVVDGVYDTAERRIALLKAFNGDERICIWLDTPLDIIKSRFGRMMYRERPFEPPTHAEGWDEIIIINKENANGIRKTDMGKR